MHAQNNLMPLTYNWSDKDDPPPELEKVRRAWSAHVVNIEKLRQFAQEHPEVEQLGGRSCNSAKKLLEGDLEDKPVWMSFWYWLRNSSGRGDEFCFNADGTIRFDLGTDYYKMWTLCGVWMKWRVPHMKGSKADNGWWRHGIRLIARFQYWTIIGKDNWTNPDGKQRESKRKAPTTLVVSKQQKLADESSDDERDDDGAQDTSAVGDVTARLPAPRRGEKQPKFDSRDGEDPEEICADAIATLSKVETDKKFVKCSRNLMTAYVRDLEEKEVESKCNLHTSVENIFLWNLMPYTNEKRAIPSTKLLKMLDSDFKEMSKQQYETHMLRDFYEEREHGGYRPIWIFNSETGSWQRLGTIEHILPTSFFMFNHPRFYMMCHSRINSHMSNKVPEYRLACGLKRYELSLVKSEVERFKAMDECKAALVKFYATMRDVVRPC